MELANLTKIELESGIIKLGSGLQEIIQEISTGTGSGSSDGDHLRQKLRDHWREIQGVLDYQIDIIKLPPRERPPDVMKTIHGSGILRSSDGRLFRGASMAATYEKLAREYKKSIKALSSAHLTLSECIIAALGGESLQFQSSSQNDLDNATGALDRVFSRAREKAGLLPGEQIKEATEARADGQAETIKRARLRAMPCIVMMVASARAKLDALLLKYYTADEPGERDGEHLKNIRSLVSGLIDDLKLAIENLVANTSLLDIALDYQLPLGAYCTFIQSFMASIDALPNNPAPAVVDVWDDGLSAIREAFCWNADTHDYSESQHRLQLSSDEMRRWWSVFSGSSVDASSVSTRAVCWLLGAELREWTSHIVFHAGSQARLMQLSPPQSLRAGFCDKISKVLQVEQQILESVGCVNPLRSDSGQLNAVLPQYKFVGSFSAAKQEIYTIAVRPDGRQLVTAGGDRQAQVWALGSAPKKVRSVQLQARRTMCMALCPDGETAVSGGEDNRVHVWGITDGKLKCTFQGHKDAVSGVTVLQSRDLVVSTSLDKTIRVWSMKTGKAARAPIKCEERVLCATFSPDGKTLLAGFEGGKIRAWKKLGGGPAFELVGHRDDVSGVVVTPDSKRAVSGSGDRAVLVWDLEAREKLMFCLLGHDKAITSVVMFPGGERVASSSEDGNIIVWNLGTGTREKRIKIAETQMIALGVTPDESTLVTGGTDGKIRVWTTGGPMTRLDSALLAIATST